MLPAIQGFLLNPSLHNWLWKYILTPLVVGIFFGIGNFSAYYLCHTKYVKKIEKSILDLIN
jgi:hypothetical protein